MWGWLRITLSHAKQIPFLHTGNFYTSLGGGPSPIPFFSQENQGLALTPLRGSSRSEKQRTCGHPKSLGLVIRYQGWPTTGCRPASPLFIQRELPWNTATPIIYILSTAAFSHNKQTRCDRDHMAHKPKIFRTWLFKTVC